MGEKQTATQLPKVRQDPKAWEEGYNAGFEGKAVGPSTGVDELAFYSGLIEGKADKIQGRRRDHKPPTQQP